MYYVFGLQDTVFARGNIVILKSIIRSYLPNALALLDRL